MSEHHTEEQQVEALKKWWAENGKSVIAGVVIGLVGLFGWNAYQANQRATAAAASDAFAQVMENADDKLFVEAVAGKLMNEYEATPYAALSALMLARVQFHAGESDQALASLEWVVAHARDEALVQLATIRKARIQMQQQKLDDALATLAKVEARAFVAVRDELKGDVLAQQGRKEEAAAAYREAMQVADQGASAQIERKLQFLGV